MLDHMAIRLAMLSWMGLAVRRGGGEGRGGDGRGGEEGKGTGGEGREDRRGGRGEGGREGDDKILTLSTLHISHPSSVLSSHLPVLADTPFWHANLISGQRSVVPTEGARGHL